jgi:hypothetical protein
MHITQEMHIVLGDVHCGATSAFVAADSSVEMWLQQS